MQLHEYIFLHDLLLYVGSATSLKLIKHCLVTKSGSVNFVSNKIKQIGY